MPATAGATDLASIPGHNRQPRAKVAEFFTQPPAEIGTLISADSTLGVTLAPLMRWFAWLGVAAVVLVGFLLMAAQESRPQAQTATTTGAVIAIAILLIAVFVEWQRKYYCTYVGDRGIARYSIHKQGGQPKAEALLFADAEELKTSQVRQFVNGIYTGTRYKYAWTAPDGRVLFRCAGSYMGKKKPPKAISPWHFANAADLAWSNHYLQRAQQSLEADGSIPFRVDSKRWVRVGPGFMEFHFGGEPVRIEKTDIATVKLGGGMFSFKSKDAKWFSRDGKYSFSYGSMANAKVFLLALEKLMGYRWN